MCHVACSDYFINLSLFIHTWLHASGLSQLKSFFGAGSESKYTGALLYEQHRAGPKIDHTRGFLTIELTRGLL